VEQLARAHRRPFRAGRGHRHRLRADKPDRAARLAEGGTVVLAESGCNGSSKIIAQVYQGWKVTTE
jgi:hypothetical protein